MRLTLLVATWQQCNTSHMVLAVFAGTGQCSLGLSPLPASNLVGKYVHSFGKSMWQGQRMRMTFCSRQHELFKRSRFWGLCKGELASEACEKASCATRRGRMLQMNSRGR